ncbi:MAG: SBBP repeat-containing protein [Planctomycetota bacterium]
MCKTTLSVLGSSSLPVLAAVSLAAGWAFGLCESGADSTSAGMPLLAPAPDEHVARWEGPEVPAPERARLVQAFGKLPLYFVENQGQLREQVAFCAQGLDKTIHMTKEGITFSLGSQEQHWTVKLDFVEANAGVLVRGEEKQEATFNYFKGRPEEWKTRVPAYGKVVYEDIWPGIDLFYSGTASCLKHEFVVQPGADPRRIQLRYRGATEVRLGEQGQLVVTTPVASFEDAPPVAYQETGTGAIEVQAAYSLLEPAAQGEARVSFVLGDYDTSLPLVVDPAVVFYSGYLGGSNDDWGWAVAVDSSGAAYVTGQTLSTDFPVVVGPDLTPNGGDDAFVTRIDPSGALLAYSGYLGGSGFDMGYGIAVDEAGAAYVTGMTWSYDFPALVGPDLTFNGGYYDGFVTKIDPSGAAFVYSSFLGGSLWDQGLDIAVDGSGAAYVTGSTGSWDFPRVGGPDSSYNGGDWDVFVTKIAPHGFFLLYSGYLGGSGNDLGYGIAVDESGAAYLTGETRSANFPAVRGPDPTLGGSVDAFVACIEDLERMGARRLR